MKKSRSIGIIAALIGLSQVTWAGGGKHQFTPIEELPPELRQQISEQLHEITKDLDIDWDTMAIGINEEGQIALRPKSSFNATIAGGFSCASNKTEK